MKPFALRAALSAALAAPAASHAVMLNADGIGQALLYPYYTVQSDNGNSWNTLVTVVNHSPDAKALRVRFREGRNARPVASLNLFLSPNDVWTGAVIPSDQMATSPALLLTADASCTSPQLSAVLGNNGMTFNNTFYAGNFSDGFGEGLDRTREGFVEIIEMATLTGASAAAVTHNTGTGLPANCAVVQSGLALDVAAPTGGLSGTLALIAVNNGLDFNSNAEALADLTTRPFYRAATDSYPDFNAVEIEPVSTVIANGNVYRSVWTRPADAVSAVLMRSTAAGEFVLDRNTRSRSDFIVTLPTRSFYVQGNSFSAPFEWPTPIPGVSEQFITLVTDRSTHRSDSTCEIGFSPIPECKRDWPWAANVFAISNTFGTGLVPASSLLGSRNGRTPAGNAAYEIPPLFENGSITFRVSPVPSTVYRNLVSQPSSTRLDIATGQVTSGAHTFRGLPLMGMALRTFENGTLVCSAGACQGNYGGSFPAVYERNISP